MDAMLQELHDKQAIHDAVMRYCRGVDRLDPVLLASAYHPDAYDDHGSWYQGDIAGFVEWVMKEYQVHTAIMTTILNESYRAGPKNSNRRWPGAIPA